MSKRALRWMLAPLLAAGLLAGVRGAWPEWGAAAAARSPRQGAAPPPASAPAPAVPAPSGGAVRQEAAPQPSAAPLPPHDTPLKDSFAPLDAAARRGDARAACRLGAALARCIDLERALPWYRPDTAPGASPTARALAAAADACRGFDPRRAPDALFYLELAARRGHLPAMLEYLEPTRLAPTDLLRDAGLATRYRLQAPRFFQRLLQSGDLGVLALWIEATHFPDAIPLSALLPPAWREPGLARAVFEQLTPAQRSLLPLSWRSYGEHRAAPTAAQQAEALGIYRRYFAASIHSSRRPRAGGGELAVEALLDPQRIDCGSAERAD